MTPNAATSRFTYEQVATELRQDIAAGRFAPGERLPSIRALADRFDISPTTAGNAMKFLRDQGVVHSGSTTGYYVAEVTTGGHVVADQGAALSAKLDAVLAELAQLGRRVSALEAGASQDADLHVSQNQHSG